MKRKALLGLAVLALLSANAAALRAQEATPPTPSAQAAPPAVVEAPVPPTAFAATFFDDGNFLGVHVEDVTRENAGRYNLSGGPRGVGVREVVKGSPAEGAGLRENDVIIRFDGEQVTSVRKLNRLIEESAPEHTARLTVVRGGSEQEVSATLGKRGQRMAAGAGELLLPGADAEVARRFGEKWRDNSEEWQRKGEEMRKRLEELNKNNGGLFALVPGAGRRIGVTTHALGKQLSDYFGVSHGVLVNSVEAGSPAEKAGLRAGDVVTEADGEKIEDAGDLSKIISRRQEGEVTLTVVRDRKQRTVRLTPERRQPQGFDMTPGAFRVVVPSVAVTMPRLDVTAPRVNVIAPRMRVTTPRVRVLRGSGDRVL
jgi:serine protease Do